MSRMTWIGWLVAGLLALQIAPHVLGAGQGSDGGAAGGGDGNTTETLALQGSLGQAFTYQGYLTSSGKPVNGTRRMEFKLVTAPTMGKVVAGPMEKSVVVSDGLFDTTLDFDGTPFDGRALWLSMRMREPNGSWANLGVQPILAVPYAASLMPGAKVVESSSSGSALELNNRDGRALVATGGFRGVDAITTGTEENHAAVSGQSVADSGEARGGSFASRHGTGVYAVSLGGHGIEAKGCSNETGCYGGYFEGSGGVYAKALGSRPGPAGRFEGDVTVNGLLHGHDATFYDITADDLTLEGTARLNRDVFITGEDSKLAVSGPMITSYPRPAFDSGWVSVGKSDHFTMNHNLGGDADDYVVDFQCKSSAGIGIYGIGGYKSGFVPQPLVARGGYYHSLKSNSIKVRRMEHDGSCGEMRVRIWVIK